MHKLLKLYCSVVKRKYGSGLLVIKFHLCLHFLENQLDFGVTSNVDTGPMESNHKCNAKKPSGQTQRHADTFELQTSRQYIENLILDKAVSTLEETYPARKRHQKLEPPLVGVKFSIQLTNNRDDNLLPGATIIWDKSHCIETSYHPWFLGGFAAISWLYLDRMPPSVDVQNTSRELQLEINSFSGLTLPGEVAGVGMIGPSFPGPTRMGRMCVSLAKLLHSYGLLKRTSVRSNTCLMCPGIRPVYMP
jgi:hypothetical protein